MGLVSPEMSYSPLSWTLFSLTQLRQRLSTSRGGLPEFRAKWVVEINLNPLASSKAFSNRGSQVAAARLFPWRPMGWPTGVGWSGGSNGRHGRANNEICLGSKSRLRLVPPTHWGLRKRQLAHQQF